MKDKERGRTFWEDQARLGNNKQGTTYTDYERNGQTTPKCDCETLVSYDNIMVGAPIHSFVMNHPSSEKR